MAKNTHEWHGDRVNESVGRAVIRAEIAWGETAVSKSKQLPVHRLSGTLSRSLHAAPADHDVDETRQAEVSVIASTPPKERASDPVIRIAWGSWIDYAGFERKRGGSHDWMTGPTAEASGAYPRTLESAMAAAGLTRG